MECVADAPCPSGSADAGTLLLFGGSTIVGSRAENLADTWQWDGAHWIQSCVTGPGARFGMNGATLSGRPVLFGGATVSMTLDDTWTWNGSGWSTVTPAVSPPARFEGASASLGATLVLFGGVSSSATALGDTWVWDGASWAQQEVPGPGARSSPAVATLQDTVVLFGGNTLTQVNAGSSEAYVVNTPLADTWTWDGSSWTEHHVTGPSPRFGATMATLGDQVVLFGGNAFMGGTTTPLGDTWAWDGMQWKELQVTGPSPRIAAASATFGNVIVLFGGYAGGDSDLGDTWTWDGSQWAAVSAQGPTAREDAMLVAY